MACRMIEQLVQHARRRPDAAALGDRLGASPRRVSWSMLLAASAVVAQQVRRLAGPGGVALLLCDNQAEFFPAFLGTLMADRVIFPLSPGLTAHELEQVVQLARPSLVIGNRQRIGPLVSKTIAAIAVEDLRWDDSADVAAAVRNHQGTGAMWLMSSGTTGQPKIVSRSAAAVDAVGDNCAAAIDYTPDDTLLAVTPLCHSYTIDHAMAAAMISGATVRLVEGFDPALVMSEMMNGRATLMPGIPFLYEAMLTLGDASITRSTHRIKCVFSAGSPLPAAVYEPFDRRFGLRIGQVYGSTEFASVTFNDPHDTDFDPASAGRALPGVSIRITPGDGASAGDEGEINVAAPSMFESYVGQTESLLCEGYLASGDLGRVDGTGRLYVTGRLKLLIDVRGMKVNPLEVEAVLKTHRAIAEAVVVPVEVTATGNRLNAIVPVRPGEPLDEAVVSAHARRQLSAHKVPRSIEVRPALPRSATGKVIRGALA